MKFSTSLKACMCVAKCKTSIWKDVRPPQRYGEADLVAYALNVAEGINSIKEPSTYSEAVSCDDYGRWMIVI